MKLTIEMEKDASEISLEKIFMGLILSCKKGNAELELHLSASEVNILCDVLDEIVFELQGDECDELNGHDYPN